MAIALAAIGLTPAASPGQAPPARAFVPYSEAPINYDVDDTVHDPVARLHERLDRGEAAIEYEPKRGYLDSVLRLLDVPVASQTLVFSKTSLQYKKIGPKSPRAIYFNDNIYVGWVKEADLLEIASFDANQGAIFYVIEQKPSAHPSLQRATIDCTQCHVAPGTRGVPGVLLRSVFPTPSGSQVSRSRSTITGHGSPLEGRWGGWYITGTTGTKAHLGNAFFARDGQPPRRLEGAAEGPADLAGRFATSDYLSGQSDVVAHLVLAHQTQMHNLITLVNYKARIAQHAEDVKAKAQGRPPGPLPEASRRQYEAPAEELLQYLVFSDEAPLDGPLAGASGFARGFAGLGPRDPEGRSLRDFDLKRRIFKYPCSYLIYTEAFDAIPGPAKSYIFRRLLEVLTGRDRGAEFAHLSDDDRRAILEILLATKPGLPDDWKKGRP